MRRTGPVRLGRFSMVCRDANTHRAKAVNPLTISTPEEKALYSLGEGAQQSYSSLSSFTEDLGQT